MNVQFNDVLFAAFIRDEIKPSALPIVTPAQLPDLAAPMLHVYIDTQTYQEMVTRGDSQVAPTGPRGVGTTA